MALRVGALFRGTVVTVQCSHIAHMRCVMTMPGFTAETVLGKSVKYYRLAMAFATGLAGQVAPAISKGTHCTVPDPTCPSGFSKLFCPGFDPDSCTEIGVCCTPPPPPPPTPAYPRPGLLPSRHVLLWNVLSVWKLHSRMKKSVWGDFGRRVSYSVTRCRRKHYLCSIRPCRSAIEVLSIGV